MADEFLGHEPEEWAPMPINMGPPLPRFLNIYWPWYKEEVPGVFTCPYCGATFATQEELNQHILTAHPEVPPVTYPCPYCGVEFSTEAELNYHIQTVHPEAPPTEEVKITSITLDQTELLACDGFTIGISFNNPTDSDIWVKPKFAFGNLVDGEFVPERVLCRKGSPSEWGKGPEYGYWLDPNTDQDWLELGDYIKPEKGMLIPRDPDGITVVGHENEVWLKVPAKGQATVSGNWAITGKEFAYGARDICVIVEKAFRLVYDPGWTTTTIAIPPVTFTAPWTYKTVTVNWRPASLEESFSGIAQDIATIGLAPGAITIDGLEVRIHWSQAAYDKVWRMVAFTKVTITNHTKRTFGKGAPKSPFGRSRAILNIEAYYGQSYGIRKLGDALCTLFAASDYFTDPYSPYYTQGPPIPPGTTIYTFGYLAIPGVTGITVPEGLKGLAWVNLLFDVTGGLITVITGKADDAGFKGIFSSENQVWTPTPIQVTDGKVIFL